MTAGSGRSGWNTRFTTEQLISFGLLTTMVVFLVASICGAVTLVRASTLTDELIDRVAPARGTAQQLQLALLNQQTGIDGYVLGREQFFLRPYEQGVADEQTALTSIRGLLAGSARDLALIDTVEQAGRQWRTDYAEPVIADIAAGRSAAAQRVERGKALFDRVREATQALFGQLSAERTTLRDTVNATRAERNWTLGAALFASLATSLAFGLLMRRGVLLPLQKLGAATRRVGAGDFTHRITAGGPADIAALAEAPVVPSS